MLLKQLFSRYLSRLLFGLGGIGLMLIIQGCGFRIQGASPLPFNKLYTNISLNSSFGAQLERMLIANTPKLEFVSDRKEAQASLIQIHSRRITRDVALDPQGNVEEYQLYLQFRFELLDSEGRKIISPITLLITRHLPNDPNATQAKESERDSMYSSMEEDLIERLSRRLTAPDVSIRFEELQHQPVTDDDLEQEDIEWQDDDEDVEEEFLPVFN